jgi:hypothetical protein
MPRTPHREKLIAAIANPKCERDVPLLREAQEAYARWVRNGCITIGWKEQSR